MWALRLPPPSVAPLVSDSSLPASSVKDHLNLDGLALVESHRGVGGVGRSRYVGVVSKPLVLVLDVAKPVGIGDPDCVRRQRLAHLGRTADGWALRWPDCWAVGAAATASVAALVSVSFVALVVGEAHLHLDGLALVGVGQGVGRAGSACDFRVVGKPLVAEGGVR